MMPKSGDQVNTSTQKRGQPSRPMRASRSSRSRPISSLPLPPLRALFRTPRAQYPEDIGDTHFGDSTRCWPHRWTHSNPKFAHILLAALRAAPRGAFLLPSLRLCALQNPNPACQTPRAYLRSACLVSSVILDRFEDGGHASKRDQLLLSTCTRNNNKSNYRSYYRLDFSPHHLPRWTIIIIIAAVAAFVVVVVA